MANPTSKRRSERVTTSLPVRWIRRGNIVQLTVADINLHGMFLLTQDLSVVPGELMQIQIVLSEKTVLDAFVIARFVGKTASGCGIGVEIFVMDERQQLVWSQHYRATAQRRRAVKTVAVAAVVGG